MEWQKKLNHDHLHGIMEISMEKDIEMFSEHCGMRDCSLISTPRQIHASALCPHQIKMCL